MRVSVRENGRECDYAVRLHGGSDPIGRGLRQTVQGKLFAEHKQDKGSPNIRPALSKLKELLVEAILFVALSCLVHRRAVQR